MPRPAKTRVCTETEKRKAEIFNNIDDLILTGCWDEALDKLGYLFRNAPSLRARVHRKLAYIHFEMKNYQKSLGHLHYIIPTKEVCYCCIRCCWEGWVRWSCLFWFFSA